MRYSELEKTVLVGQFKTGQAITIKLIELSNDNIVEISNNNCIESQHMPGIYLWSTDYIVDNSLVGYSNLLYEMTSVDDGRKYYGKFIYGGYVDKDVSVDLSEVLADTNEIKNTTHIINARI